MFSMFERPSGTIAHADFPSSSRSHPSSSSLSNPIPIRFSEAAVLSLCSSRSFVGVGVETSEAAAQGRRDARRNTTS